MLLLHRGVTTIHRSFRTYCTYAILTCSSKHDGLAGTRFGWALVKDPDLARDMWNIVFSMVIATSIDIELRILTSLRAILGEHSIRPQRKENPSWPFGFVLEGSIAPVQMLKFQLKNLAASFRVVPKASIFFINTPRNSEQQHNHTFHHYILQWPSSIVVETQGRISTFIEGGEGGG